MLLLIARRRAWHAAYGAKGDRHYVTFSFAPRSETTDAIQYFRHFYQGNDAENDLSQEVVVDASVNRRHMWPAGSVEGMSARVRGMLRRSEELGLWCTEAQAAAMPGPAAAARM